jgi:hypothetical protein
MERRDPPRSARVLVAQAAGGQESGGALAGAGTRGCRRAGARALLFGPDASLASGGARCRAAGRHGTGSRRPHRCPGASRARPSRTGHRTARNQRAGHAAGDHLADRLRPVRAAQSPRDRRFHRAGRPAMGTDHLRAGLAAVPCPPAGRRGAPTAGHRPALRCPSQGATRSRGARADSAGPGRGRLSRGQAPGAEHRVADPPRAVALPPAVRRPGPAAAYCPGRDSFRGRADGPGAGQGLWAGHGVVHGRT